MNSLNPSFDPTLDLDLSSVQLHPTPNQGVRKKLLTRLNDDDYILHIDNTSLESFLACDLASFYRLVLGRTTYPTPALIYGQAIHSGLEYLYKYGPDLSKMIALGQKELDKLPEDPQEWRNLGAMARTFELYLKEYKQDCISPLLLDNKPCVELAFKDHVGSVDLNTELKFSHETLVVDGESLENVYVKTLHIVWTGVIDVISEEMSHLMIVDHKTSSVLGPSYYDQFNLSQQFIGYTRAAKNLLQRPVLGALLNVIAGRKPSKTGVNLEFSRRRYMYPEHLLDEWQDDILTLVGDFVNRLQVGHFPKRTLWCTGKFGTCPYMSACSLAPDLRPTMIYSDSFTDNLWDPLKK